MLTQGGWRKFDLELLPKSWYIFSNIRQVRSGRHERRRWLIQQGRLESHLACRLPRPIGLTIRLQHRVFQGFIHIPQTHLIWYSLISRLAITSEGEGQHENTGWLICSKTLVELTWIWMFQQIPREELGRQWNIQNQCQRNPGLGADEAPCTYPLSHHLVLTLIVQTWEGDGGISTLARSANVESPFRRASNFPRSRAATPVGGLDTPPRASSRSRQVSPVPSYSEVSHWQSVKLGGNINWIRHAALILISIGRWKSPLLFDLHIKGGQTGFYTGNWSIPCAVCAVKFSWTTMYSHEGK